MVDHLIPLNRFSEGNQIWVASLGEQQNNSPYHWTDFFSPNPFIISELVIKKTNSDSYRNITESHTIKIITTLNDKNIIFNFDIIKVLCIEYVKVNPRKYLDFDYDIVYDKLLNDSLCILKEKWSGINGIKSKDAFKKMLHFNNYITMFVDYPELLI